MANADGTNANIYANGYKLYVGGKEVAINQSKDIPEMVVATDTETQTVQETGCDNGGDCSNGNNMGWIAWIAGGVALAAIIAIVVIMIKGRKKEVLPENEPTYEEKV